MGAAKGRFEVTAACRLPESNPLSGRDNASEAHTARNLATRLRHQEIGSFDVVAGLARCLIMGVLGSRLCFLGEGKEVDTCRREHP